jgi:murein DD-endopeptidase MepM/ murein hydrolase activator NlpD
VVSAASAAPLAAIAYAGTAAAGLALVLLAGIATVTGAAAGMPVAGHAGAGADCASAACPVGDPAGDAPIVTPAPGCVSPLPQASLTSRFGWRTHPITGRRAMHAGIDLASGPHGRLGDPIRAACGGVVVFAGPASGYGTYIAVQHAGFVTGYGHMWTTPVRAGQRVRVGQVIAFVGCAGSCTGPHLHFEVRPTVWGRPTDPVAFFAARGLVIP